MNKIQLGVIALTITGFWLLMATDFLKAKIQSLASNKVVAN